MSYTVLARRYRSRDFDELVGQEAVARTLRNAIASERTAHAYLFCGTRGVGKTSMARIFARALNQADQTQAEAIGDSVLRGEDLDVIEIDGASNRGVNEARELIASAGLMPARSPWKIYIIDEVHMLTNEAFNALLKTMEEPPSHVKFILCTTEPHKVPATIQSRCQRFDFRPLSTNQIAEQLRVVLEGEGLEAEDAVVTAVARQARGSMRDGLSLLDRLLAAGENPLTVKLLEDLLGLADQTIVDELVDAIADADPATGLRAGAKLLDNVGAVEPALATIIESLRTLMLAGVCGADADLVEVGADEREAVAARAARFDTASIVHMIAICEAVARQTKGSTTARALFDAAIVRMCLAGDLIQIPAALAGRDAAGDEKKKSVTPAPPPRVADPAPASSSKPKPTPKSAPPASTPKPTSAPPASKPRSPDVSTEVKPRPKGDAPAPPATTAAPCAIDPASDPTGAAFWSALNTQARSTKDRALLALLRPVALEDGAIRLRIDAASPSERKYVRTQREKIAHLISEASSSPVVVRFDDDGSSSAEESTTASRAAAAQSPLVKEAMTILDATIAGFEPPPPSRPHAEEDAPDV